MNELTAKIRCFLQEIGLVYHLEKIEETLLLQWYEMCYDNKNATLLNVEPFHKMISWMCTLNKYEAIIL